MLLASRAPYQELYYFKLFRCSIQIFQRNILACTKRSSKLGLKSTTGFEYLCVEKKINVFCNRDGESHDKHAGLLFTPREFRLKTLLL